MFVGQILLPLEPVPQSQDNKFQISVSGLPPCWYFRLASVVKMWPLWGCHDDSVGKGACSQAWQPKSDTKDPHGGMRERRELNLTHCP